ncbi:MAG: DUF3347 domain-containing protein [Flavisolibacter sp.]
MRTLLLFFLLVILCSCGESEKSVVEKPRSSKFSSDFNSGLLSFLDSYYALSDLFVKWDSASLGPAAGSMIKSLDNLDVEKDSVVKSNFSHVKNVLNSDLTTIMQTNVTLENKRKAFHHFSENFYNFLRNIKYDAAKVYLHECTMPFNDTGRAVWLSKSDTLRNPYLGMYHPRYGSGMLECGTEEATIDYTANEK